MAYKALYRTYRPSTFQEVAGQKHIVKTLQNSLKENKIAHAYLFCGPRGTGKTSMARLFAKALNCEDGFGHQCNECDNCISISEGSHPDVIEIDAASNRGIDDIRDLIEKVRYAPIRGDYKVYIIDEVHMLTTEAFNALLKTLEEPPANVVFILATTEPFKLMPTILSRCQRYDFMKVGNEDLHARLKEICKAEGVNATERAISLLVSLADGGVRDALSMLDQAMAYAGDDLEEYHINEIFGLSSTSEKIKLLRAVKQNDIVLLSSLCDTYLQKGLDIRRLTTDLLDILKDLLIAKNTKDNSLLRVLTADEVLELSFKTSEINQMIDHLLSAVTQYRFVASINSLFEITLLKMASIFVKEEKEVVDNNKINPATRIETKQEIISMNKEIVKEDLISVDDFNEFGTPIEFSDDDILNIMVQASKNEKQTILDIWNDLSVNLDNPKLSKYVATLKQCFPRIVSKEVIVLESTFTSIVSRVNYKENQAGFKKIIQSLTGREFIIICLTHDQLLENTQHFRELNQARKLPEAQPIDIKLN